MNKLFSLHNPLIQHKSLIQRFFKSAISLDKLYPESSGEITTPSADQIKTPDGLKFNGYIPIEKLDIKYSRSSGPGGQNVNTTNTKVDLRFNVKDATWLDEEIRNKLFQMNKYRLNKEGYLIIKSEKTRSQQLNLADAMTMLRNMIWKAAKPEHIVSEETIDHIRQRQEKRNRERIIEKKMKSYTKQQRRDQIVDL